MWGLSARLGLSRYSVRRLPDTVAALLKLLGRHWLPGPSALLLLSPGDPLGAEALVQLVLRVGTMDGPGRSLDPHRATIMENIRQPATTQQPVQGQLADAGVVDVDGIAA